MSETPRSTIINPSEYRPISVIPVSDVIIMLTDETDTRVLDSNDITVTDVFLPETEVTKKPEDLIPSSASSLNDKFMEAYLELKRLSELLEINVTTTLS